MGDTSEREEEEEEEKRQDKSGLASAKPPADSDDDSEESSDEDDLNLEGVLIRNPDAFSSSDEEDEEEEDKKKRATPKDANQPSGKKKKKKSPPEDDVVHVEFTFHDFEEKFFHGVKSLLHSCSTVHQSHSSALTDLMMENVSVGTVCSTEGDVDGSVYGFGSVLNVQTYGDRPCIRALKALCLDRCPPERRHEMEILLSGTTKRPAGFLFHARMVNLPLEIVEVLHHQLVLDMDWAVEHAEGGELERKSLDFGAFVRLAPATMDSRSLVYRYFDDEIMASHAEFLHSVDAPPSYGSEEKHMVSVIVLTKTGHRAAMKELKQMVGSGPDSGGS